MSDMFEDGFDSQDVTPTFSFGGDKTSQEDLYNDIKYVESPGRYHMIVRNTKFENVGSSDRCAAISLKLEVLEGTNKSQVGRVMYHRMMLESWADKDNHGLGKGPLAEWAVNANRRLLVSLGAIRSSVSGDGTVETEAYKIDQEFIELLVGLQMIAEVKMSQERTYGGKTYPPRAEIPFSTSWPLGHKAVAEVPCDTELAPISSAAGDAAADL